jgi:hypothetical protein
MVVEMVGAVVVLVLLVLKQLDLNPKEQLQVEQGKQFQHLHIQ